MIHDDEDLTVTYATSGGWSLVETHLAVGRDLEQYAEELALMLDVGSGAPHVVIDLPSTRKVGSRTELVATVTIAGGAPKGVANEARFTIKGPGLPATGSVVAATSKQSGRFGATVLLPRAGSYEIVFEANSDGIPFRAERQLAGLATKWYRRGLEAPGLSEEDTLGLLYDLGYAYLAVGDQESAYKTFVDLYGINTNYRDVVARIEELGRA